MRHPKSHKLMWAEDACASATASEQTAKAVATNGISAHGLLIGNAGEAFASVVVAEAHASSAHIGST